MTQYAPHPPYAPPPAQSRAQRPERRWVLPLVLGLCALVLGVAAGGAAGYSSRSGEVDSLQRELSDSDSRAEALAEDLVRAADDIDDLEDDLDDSLEDNLALRDTINTCQKALKVQLNNVVQALKASDSYLSLYYLGQIRVNNPQTKVCLQFARGVAGNATEG